MQFTVGENAGAAILEDEMVKIEEGRLLSIEVDKWGSVTCYDDMSGDVFNHKLVAAARKLEV